MKNFYNMMLAAALTVVVHVAHAESNPAIELSRMMKRMYSYPVREFEYGENPSTGRLDAVRNCTMLRAFFDAPILQQAKGIKKCSFEYSRFAPYEDGTPMEETVTADGMNLPPPIPFIQSIKVSGDQAQIDILFGAADAPKGKLPNARDNQGRVVFYLKQLTQGWRIVNKLSFKRWPLKLDGEYSDCRMVSSDYHFALIPHTAADLAFLPPACQKLEQQALTK